VLAPFLHADRLPTAYVDAITHGRRDQEDSFHLLVMDLPRETNRLQQTISTETVDGASVYPIHEGDRRHVS
jgi:hypothetical protein